MTTATVDLDAILAKVQKMLNVQGRTPEEAAAYVEKAHAMLAQYDLTIEAVTDLKADPRTAVRKADVGTEVVEGKPDSWKADVLAAVAAAFECRVLWEYQYEETKSGRSRYKKVAQIVGFGHDVEAAGYAQSFVVNEIVRLSKAYSREMWDDIKRMARERGISNHDAERHYVFLHGTHPLKAEVYFVKGAAQTISEALTRETRIRHAEAVAHNPNALVVQKSDEVKDYLGREQYGDKWDDIKKARAEREAEYQRQAEESKALRTAHMEGKHEEPVARCSTCKAEAEAARETPAQRKRREEREARQQERANRTYWNQYEREQRKTDHDALRAGQQAGRTIKIRPGIRPGDTEGHIA